MNDMRLRQGTKIVAEWLEIREQDKGAVGEEGIWKLLRETLWKDWKISLHSQAYQACRIP